MLLDVFSEMVNVNRLGEGLAWVSLLRFKVYSWRFRKSIQRYFLVLCVSNLLQFHMRNLLVVDVSRVMSDNVTW